MIKLLMKIKKNLSVSIPFIMAAGLLYGYFYNPSYLKVWIIPMTFLMVYPMMVTMQLKKVFSKGDVKLQIFTQVINFIVIPAAAFALGKLFFPGNQYIALGLLLAALLPTSGMTISWTGFSKGNMNEAVKMTVIGLVAGSLAAPVYTKLLMGQSVSIPLIKVFKQIFLIVFLPMTAGYITQRILIRKFGQAKYSKDLKKNFPAISTIGVLGIVFVAMALKAKTIISQPQMLAGLVIPLIILYSFNFFISTIVGKVFFERKNGVTLVYGTVMRNLSIALAIAMIVFGEKGSDVALIIAIAFVIQVQSAALYVKFADKFFGPAPEDTAGDIMNRGIFALDNTASVQDAIKMLDEEHIHSLAVLDENHKPYGLVSSEMIIGYLADGISRDEILKNIKPHPILKIPQSALIRDVIKQMKRDHEYKVLVMGDDHKIKGVLTQDDVLANFAKLSA